MTGHLQELISPTTGLFCRFARPKYRACGRYRPRQLENLEYNLLSVGLLLSSKSAVLFLVVFAFADLDPFSLPCVDVPVVTKRTETSSCPRQLEPIRCWPRG